MGEFRRTGMKIPIIIACLVSVCYPHPYLQDFIPNGHDVPNPCKGGTSKVWAGVGHTNISGGGQLNQFGQDFFDNLYYYTPSLCNMDSDGDGQINGVELGDPNCTWYYGTPERAAPAIGHPGICEPMDDMEC